MCIRDSHWILDAPKVSKKEQMITQMVFMSLAELQEVRHTMETWSQLCLDNLGEMENAAERLDG